MTALLNGREAATAVAPATGVRAGQWAVVLGASSGMGRAVALRAAAEGMHVFGVHLDTASRQDDIAAQVAELEGHGVSVHFVNGNAAGAATRELAVAELRERCAGSGVGLVLHSLAFGSLLPYVPGPDGADDAALLSPKQMTMTLEVMAHSLVWWVRDLLAAGVLLPGSHVLAMTSAGDSRVAPSYGAVSAAKSALLAHCRQLAVELAPSRISVNALRAGVTLTPSLERIPGSARLVDVARAANPHGRLTTPEDVAEAALTLAASSSGWVTGNVVAVDGGEGLTT
ncbi:SDR family oxidoreductase [Modestobacter versicolor]|uniref:SDR family oxidoreductase n=1 Tax=Modestobacter versicolor TaxID=429133 RepID=UPI0034DFE15F